MWCIMPIIIILWLLCVLFAIEIRSKTMYNKLHILFVDIDFVHSQGYSRRNKPWLTKSVLQAVRKYNQLFRKASIHVRTNSAITVKETKFLDSFNIDGSKIIVQQSSLGSIIPVNSAIILKRLNIIVCEFLLEKLFNTFQKSFEWLAFRLLK